MNDDAHHDDQHHNGASDRFDVGAALTGLVFTALGVLFLLEALDVANFRFEVVLPIIAIALGVAFILRSVLRSRPAHE